MSDQQERHASEWGVTDDSSSLAPYGQRESCKKLEILHQVYPSFSALNLGVLSHVATMRTYRPLDYALELAFQRTQNASGPWATHDTPELAPMPKAHRSTMVGDIIVVDDVRAFQCIPTGWTERDIGLVRILRQP